MTDQEYAAYRDGRYAMAIKYYDDRAKRCQILHHCCSVYVILVSILIAPMLGMDNFLWWKATSFVKVLSPTLAIVASIAAYFRFHENWISYRSTWDALQHEVPCRDAKVNDYKDVQDRNALFVLRVEDLISREGVEWLNRHRPKDSTPSASSG